MSNSVRFKQGRLEALTKQDISNGTLWFTTDEAAIYLDINDSRVRFGDYITVADVAALPENGHAYESALYYAKAENILARWDATDKNWVQLNVAGLSEIAITGSGNVLSGASVSYDKTTGKKKLTFTTTSVLTSDGLQDIQTQVTGLDDRTNKIEAKLADVDEEQTVGGLISAAKTELQGKIDAVDTLAGQGIADAAAAKAYAQSVQTNLNATNTKISGIESQVKTLEDAVNAAGGSVDEKIEDAVADLKGTTENVTIKGAMDAAANAKSAADAAQGTANAADTRSQTNSTLITGLDRRLTTAEGEIDTLQETVALLNGASTEAGSVAYQIAQVIDGAPESLDTLKEIADWIGSDTSGAAALNSRISAVEENDRKQDTKLQGLESTINTSINDIKTELKGSAVDYTDLGKAETAIQANATAVAKAQEDATKGIKDAAAAKTYAEGISTKVTGLEATLNTENTGVLARLTTAEGEIDALQQADIDLAAAYVAADTQVKTDLIGDATTYKTFGAAEDAIQKNTSDIQTANTKITGLTGQLTWETFQ